MSEDSEFEWGGYSEIDADSVNLEMFPKIKDVHYSKVTMNKGDCIFMPGGKDFYVTLCSLERGVGRGGAGGTLLRYFCYRGVIMPMKQTKDFRQSKSRTQSPQAFWSAGGRQERLWGTGILFPQDFCGKTMQAVRQLFMGKPIKKI